MNRVCVSVVCRATWLGPCEAGRVCGEFRIVEYRRGGGSEMCDEDGECVIACGIFVVRFFLLFCFFSFLIY